VCLTFEYDIFIILFFSEKAFSTLNIRTSLARCLNFGRRSPSLHSVTRQKLVARRCMKDREVNPAIKRVSFRRRPWAKFNVSPPFPPAQFLTSSSSLTNHLSTHQISIFFFPRFLLSSRSLLRYSTFKTVILGGNPTERDPGRYWCPWQSTSAVPHIFYRVRLRKTRLANMCKSKQILGSQILYIL